MYIIDGFKFKESDVKRKGNIHMNIVHNEINHYNEQIEMDIRKLQNILAGLSNDDVVLLVYDNEYDRAIAALLASNDPRTIILARSGGILSWFYPYCDYELHLMEGKLKKIDNSRKSRVSGILPMAVLGEDTHFLSLTNAKMEEYDRSLQVLNYLTVLIPEHMMSLTFALTVINAYKNNLDIVFYKTVDDIQTYISVNPQLCLLFIDGLKSGQIEKIQQIEQIGGVVISGPPIMASPLGQIKKLDSDITLHYLDINHSGDIVFESYSELERKDNAYINIECIRIEIEYVEECIASYPLINKNTVAIQMDKTGTGKMVCFFIIAEKDIDVNEIRKYLLQKLPWFAIPEKFVQVTEFPVGYDMKIDKSQLPNAFDSDIQNNCEIDENIQKTALDLLFDYVNRKVNEDELNHPIESLGLNSLLFIEYIVSLEDKIGFEMPDNMLDIMLFKNMRHVLSYITKIVEGKDETNNL